MEIDKRKAQTLKVLLIGASSAGKTSLMKSFKGQEVQQHQNATIGADYHLHKYVTKDETFDVAIWDTAGQEKFRSITRQSCRNADAALICFDLNNATSLTEAEQWVEFLSSCGDFFKILIGTKADLPIQYSKSDLAKFLSKLSKLYVEQFKIQITSAVTGQGVKQAFNLVFETAVINRKSSLQRITEHQDDESPLQQRDLLLKNSMSTFKLGSSIITQQMVSIAPDNEKKEKCCSIF